MRFIDGPAKGHRLSLNRAPIFLRVVIAENGDVDGLDQLHDTMRPGETAHVYRMVGDASHGIACGRGPHGCRSFIIADYALYAVQPPQETLRDNEAWRAWVESQVAEQKKR